MDDKEDPYPRQKIICDVDIVIAENKWHTIELEDIKQHIENIAKITIKMSGMSLPHRYVELCVLLTNDSKLRELNRNFRNKDKVTNVLSFPHFNTHHIDDDESIYSEKYDGVDSIKAHPDFLKQERQGHFYLGDIAISYQRIMHESRDRDQNLGAYLAHMIVHGVLHLLHHDHQNDEEALKMEKLETKILQHLNYEDPYANPQKA
jgi:probable rRNA maturation factor